MQLFKRLSDAWNVLIGRDCMAPRVKVCQPVVGDVQAHVDCERGKYSNGVFSLPRDAVYHVIWDGERWVRLDSSEGDVVMRRCSAGTGPIL